MTKKADFITASPYSLYQEAVFAKGWCEREQFVCVNWSKWIQWYSDGDLQNPNLPQPAFVCDTYEVAKRTCDQLNDYSPV